MARGCTSSVICFICGSLADQIEDLLGHVRFLIFYIIAGLGAGMAQVLSSPDSIVPCLGRPAR